MGCLALAGCVALFKNKRKFPEIPENPKNAEWKMLKDLQKAERLEFFAQGKSEFRELRNSIYREVREEFRDRWADYYRADKNTTGDDRRFLTDVKAQLIADQKAVLEPRRDAACAELRESRDKRYREILGNQREARAGLRWHQEAGLDTAPFFNELADRKDARVEVASGFHEAAHEVTSPPPVNAPTYVSGPFGKSRRSHRPEFDNRKEDCSVSPAFPWLLRCLPHPLGESHDGAQRVRTCLYE